MSLVLRKRVSGYRLVKTLPEYAFTLQGSNLTSLVSMVEQRISQRFFDLLRGPVGANRHFTMGEGASILTSLPGGPGRFPFPGFTGIPIHLDLEIVALWLSIFGSSELQRLINISN